VEAFARHGLELVVPDKRFDFGQEKLLAPRAGADFAAAQMARNDAAIANS
jgi:hypothetical protein